MQQNNSWRLSSLLLQSHTVGLRHLNPTQLGTVIAPVTDKLCWGLDKDECMFVSIPVIVRPFGDIEEESYNTTFAVVETTRGSDIFTLKHTPKLPGVAGCEDDDMMDFKFLGVTLSDFRELKYLLEGKTIRVFADRYANNGRRVNDFMRGVDIVLRKV